MAGILASFGCSYRVGESLYPGKIGAELSFSSMNYYSKLDKDYSRNNRVKSRNLPRFRVGMQQTGINGRAVKMVPSPDNVNGSSENGNVVINGGRSLAKELPPIEGVKVLPSDKGFSWANENYNSIQTSIDVCSYFIGQGEMELCWRLLRR